MSSVDSETQNEELDVLSSILDATHFELNRKSSTNPRTHGTLVAEVTLPNEFEIKYHPSQTRHIQYLPSIFLHFTLPDDYPSVSAPLLQIESIWMNNEQIELININLNKLWLENEHESILYLWYSSLADETLQWLNIETTLDLTLTFPAIVPQNPNVLFCSNQVAIMILNDEREKKLIFLHRSIVTCPICFNEVYGSDCFSCYTCSSISCKSCVKSYLDTLISEGRVKSITCPINPLCHVELTPTQIGSSVDKVMFHRYDRLLFQLSIESMDDIIYCPRCQKPVIISTGSENDLNNRLGECATCSFVFCIICGKTFHGINPCQYSSEKLSGIYKEFRDGTAEERLALEQKFGKIFHNLMNEMASIETIKSTARQCPHCSMFVDKLDGCNKMTCIKCHGYFCWLCLKKLSRTNPYGHFSESSSVCYQKLFEGDFDMNFW